MQIYALNMLLKNGEKKNIICFKGSYCRDPHSIPFTWLHVGVRDQ